MAETIEQKYASAGHPSIMELKLAQGPVPTSDPRELFGKCWPEEENIDDFLAALREWRGHTAVVVDTDVVSLVFKGDSRAEKYLPVLAAPDLLVSFMTEAEMELLFESRNLDSADAQRRSGEVDVV